MKITINRKILIPSLIILDILFFPYIKPLKTSLSSILLIVVLFYSNKKIFKKKYIIDFLLLFFALVSFIFSIFNYKEFMINNFNRFFIMAMMILIFLFFRDNKHLNKIRIEYLLYAYLLFNFFLAIIYFVNVSEYFYIKNFWSLSTVYESDISISVLSRFCGIVSDPNNCACLIISICAYLDSYKFSHKMNIIKKLCTIFIVFMTMSVTGIICLAVYFLIDTYLMIYDKKNSLKNFFFIMILYFSLFLTVFFLLNSTIGSLMLERVDLNTTSNIGRFDIWRNILEHISISSHILTGFGGTIIYNGNVLNPHNGFLYLLYNYGLVACVLFCNLFINKHFRLYRKNLFFMFFIINFIMNTVIIDYRASLVYILMFSFSCLRNKKTNEKTYIMKGKI